MLLTRLSLLLTLVLHVLPIPDPEMKIILHLHENENKAAGAEYGKDRWPSIDTVDCVWSNDCYNKGNLCEGPFIDAPCRCNHGVCKRTTDAVDLDNTCRSYKDCDCRYR